MLLQTRDTIVIEVIVNWCFVRSAIGFLSNSWASCYTFYWFMCVMRLRSFAKDVVFCLLSWLPSAWFSKSYGLIFVNFWKE